MMVLSEMRDGAKPAPKRRWQFSLASLLAAMTVFALFGALLRWSLVATGAGP